MKVAEHPLFLYFITENIFRRNYQGFFPFVFSSDNLLWTIKVFTVTFFFVWNQLTSLSWFYNWTAELCTSLHHEKDNSLQVNDAITIFNTRTSHYITKSKWNPQQYKTYFTPTSGFQEPVFILGKAMEYIHPPVMTYSQVPSLSDTLKPPDEKYMLYLLSPAFWR